MNAKASYEAYLKSLNEIIGQIGGEESSQGSIDSEERKAVAEIDKKYMHYAEELDNAMKAVRQQYRSVWESCTQIEGMRIPGDQRPAQTDLTWKQAVQIQEKAAAPIREWFDAKSRQAVAARQKRMKEEEAKRIAAEKVRAEEAKKKAEEEKKRRKDKAASLVEEMKRRSSNR